MSMQKGKQLGGQSQGVQRYQTTNYIGRPSTPQQRTDNFHVTAPSSPYPPQQGGGAGPPGGPGLRSIHHHHTGQQPPPQQQSQGPPGPAPTSTPPGADMNKQGIPHMQGQPQIAQGETWQLPMNYTVTSQTRPASTQAYFSGVRGPAPTRMQTHRGQIMNVPTNNVSQPMYSQHVPMPQMPPAMYAQNVSAQMPSQQMVYPTNITPMFASQPRHQNHTQSAYYPQPSHHQQLLMTSGLFPSFPSHNAQQGQYYQFTTPVNIRPGTAGAPGVGGPGLTAAATQQVVSGGCPPSALPQPGQIPLSMVPSGSMSMPTIPGDPSSGVGIVTGPPTHQTKTRRKHALDIVDPKTNKVVPVFDESNGNTPPRSGDSSARETPQLNTGPGSMDLAADFAARVAKAASEETSSSPQPTTQSPIQTVSDSHIVSLNGPDTNSLPEQTLSKQKVIPVEDTSHWKQCQPSTIGSVPSTMEKSDVSLVKTDIKVVSNVNSKPSYIVSEPPQHIPVIINKELQGEVPTIQPPTPVVSALSKGPDVELPQRPSPSKESFPALKPSIQPGIPPPPFAQSSPRRKRGDSGDKMGGPNTAEFVPSMSVHASQAAPSLPPISIDTKSQKKSPSPTIATEETLLATVPPQAVPLQVVPPQVVPPQAVPPQSVPPQAVPPLAVPPPAVPPPAVPPPAVPPPAVPPPAVPPPAVPPPAMPPPIVPPPTLPPPTLPPPTLPPPTLPPPTVQQQQQQHHHHHPQPQPPPPQLKEKREEKQRDRERSSQVKEGEKNAARSRDRAHGKEVTRSQDKQTHNVEKKTAPARDREKSSQGREKPASQHSRREITPAPVSVEDIHEVPRTVPTPLQTSENKQPNGDALIMDSSEGKAVQRTKQKKVAKMKDFNRKGSEKEGSDMDAFVEPIPDTPQAPQQTPAPHVAAPSPPVATKSPSPIPQPQPPPVAPVPEVVKKMETNEVERLAIKVDMELVQDHDLESETEHFVAVRNEENAKVTAAVLKDEPPPVIENVQPKSIPLKKLPYKEDQWSPVNPDGKKKYERDFLMELQFDPQSRKKPDNLPDLEVVLKDGQNNRVLRQGDSRALPNRSQQDSFAPNFLRGTNMRGPPVTKRNSQQGNKQKGGGKPNMIHVTLSLNQDIKLRETENAWKPGRAKPVQLSEEEAKTEELYKKVRSVLNKLTPQKFHTLVSQVQSLPIDNAERLQGVINLVFEKAVDEPNFSEAYAQMCKVLSDMQVRGDKDDQENVNFRKLLVTRCQKEFEKNSEQELDRDKRLKEIEECQDLEKKKEFQATYEEEERKIRMKSVGNIRFIGELFKLKMLTVNIMLRCIKHLLDEGDEESLECLCKLLTTVGKDLESRQSLSVYFDDMRKRSQRKDQISSRVRFMLQDVIELRQNKWVPRRDDSNPKTIDQIQKEAEKESLEMQINLNSAPQTPRRQEDRSSYNTDRKKRGGPNTNDDGWTNVTKSNRYSVDTKKIMAAGKDLELNMSLGSRTQFSSWVKGAGTNKAADVEKKSYAPIHANMYSALDVEEKKPSLSMGSSRLPLGKSAPSMEKENIPGFSKSVPDDTRQSSRSSSRDSSTRRSEESFRPSPSPAVNVVEDPDQREGKLPKVIPAAIVADPLLSSEQIMKKTQFLMDEFLQNINYPEARQTVIETFVESKMSMFVEECFNYLMEKTSLARQLLGKLIADLLKNGVIKKDHYMKGLLQFLELADDMAIDIPKIWLYIAETIVPLFSGSDFSIHDFLSIAGQSNQSKLIPEVLSLLIKEQGPNWVKDRWESEGLTWTTYLPANVIDSFVKEHKLDFLTGAGPASSLSTVASVNFDEVYERLYQFLMSETNHVAQFDKICAWINANVGEKVHEPQFARALSSAVFRSTVYKQGNTWKLHVERLFNNHSLLTKYIDNKERLELQCLYALQALVQELEHPQGLLCQIFQILWDESIISSDSFIAWEKSNDPQEVNGKAVALKSLTSFFTALKEADEESSCEES